jgi:hypothetical protein
VDGGRAEERETGKTGKNARAGENARRGRWGRTRDGDGAEERETGKTGEERESGRERETGKTGEERETGTGRKNARRGRRCGGNWIGCPNSGPVHHKDTKAQSKPADINQVFALNSDVCTFAPLRDLRGKSFGSASVPQERLHFVMGAVEMELQRISTTLKNEAHTERVATFDEVTNYARR